MAESNNTIIRRALDKARQVQARTPGRHPKLDAVVAVLTADNHDRVTGLTLPGEGTPGSKLAARVRV